MDRSRPRKSSWFPRQKRIAGYEAVERRKVNKARGLISGQTIRFAGMKARDCPFSLRRSVYRDPATQKGYGFLTNPFKLSAKTIAASYKERWQMRWPRGQGLGDPTPGAPVRLGLKGPPRWRHRL